MRRLFLFSERGMTTGSFTDDFRTTNSYGESVGRYESRSWSGADRAPKVKESASVDFRRVWIPSNGPWIGKRPKRGVLARDAYGDEILGIDVPIAPSRSRSPEEAGRKAEWHAYHKDIVSFFTGMRDEVRVSDGAPLGYGYAIQGEPSTSWLNWRYDGTNVSSNDEIATLNKLANKVKGSGFNAAIFLGEGRQTLNLIAGTAIKLAKSIHHLRRGDMTGAARALVAGTDRRPLSRYNGSKLRANSVKNMSSQWLELQYGWLPLLSDAKASAEMLAHHLALPLTTSVRSVLKVNRDWTAPLGNYSNNVKQREKIVYIYESSEAPSIAQLSGIQNPASVAWELVPFSFVVDWFYPIGSYLEARGNSSYLTGSFYKSHLRETKLTTTLSPDNGYGTKSIWQGNETYGRSVSFTRYPVSAGFSPPQPRVNTLDSALSWRHCANAIALLAGAVKGASRD